MGRQQHRCHGDPARFRVVADLVGEQFGGEVRFVADVAGGQGLLARELTKRHGFEVDVIDPRPSKLAGVSRRAEAFDAGMADYYDLIVGLHPDAATTQIVHAAACRPVVLVPCCNFWSDERLGRDALLKSIERHYSSVGVVSSRYRLDFEGPKNIALVSRPGAQAAT
jgi:hypothetical protein